MTSTVKIWNVELGNNWSREKIAATTFEAAYRKAKKLAREIPSGCGRGRIEEISLEAEADIDVLPRRVIDKTTINGVPARVFDRAYDKAVKIVEKSGDRTNNGFKRVLDEILEKERKQDGS